MSSSLHPRITEGDNLSQTRKPFALYVSYANTIEAPAELANGRASFQVGVSKGTCPSGQIRAVLTCMQSPTVRLVFRLTFFLTISGIVLSAQSVPKAPKADQVPENPLLVAGVSKGPLPSLITAPAVASVPAVVAPESAVLPVAPQPLMVVAMKQQRVSPSRKQVLAWRGLTFGEHSAAAFDAWSTRESLISGNGYERNPLMKPFANSSAIYPALQIAPFGFDYLGHRFMRSDSGLLRRAWWLPQAASITASLWCGARNIHVANLKR